MSSMPTRLFTPLPTLPRRCLPHLMSAGSRSVVARFHLLKLARHRECHALIAVCCVCLCTLALFLNLRGGIGFGIGRKLA